MILSFADVAPFIAKAIGRIQTDPALYNYVNQAQELLINNGHGQWVGTKGRYVVGVTRGMITWPRRWEAIEHYALNRVPGKPRNMEFEFMDFGPWPLDNLGAKTPLLADRANVPVQNPMPEGSTFQIQIIADVTERSGQYITIMGDNPNSFEKVRTLVGSIWQEGENILISTTPSLSINTFGNIITILKPVTNGYITVNAVESNGTVTQLARLEPNDTRPSYRMSYIPSTTAINISDYSTPTQSTTVTAWVIARHAWMPVFNPTDILLIQNIIALKEAVMSIWKAENNRIAESEAHEARAVKFLNDQLEHHNGGNKKSLVTYGIPWGRTIGR